MTDIPCLLVNKNMEERVTKVATLSHFNSVPFLIEIKCMIVYHTLKDVHVGKQYCCEKHYGISPLLFNKYNNANQTFKNYILIKLF